MKMPFFSAIGTREIWENQEVEPSGSKYFFAEANKMVIRNGDDKDPMILQCCSHFLYGN